MALFFIIKEKGDHRTIDFLSHHMEAWSDRLKRLRQKILENVN